MYLSRPDTTGLLILPPSILNSPTPTRALRLFIQDFLKLPLGQGYFNQVIAVTTIIGVLIILGFTVCLVRLIEGNLWVVRLQEAAGSRYPLVIPNSVLSFVLIEACFGILYLAYIWDQSEAFKSGHDLERQGYWFVTVWSLLFVGAWSGSVGTFFASPGILARRRRVSKKWDVSRLIPSPGLCNCLFIGVPILCVGSALAIAMPLGHQWSRAFHLWERLDAELAAQDDTTTPTADQLLAARALWDQVVEVWWLVRLGFCNWGIWAFLLLAFYLPSGANLAWTIRQQLIEQRSIQDSLDQSAHRIGRSTSRNAVKGQIPVWHQQGATEEANEDSMTQAVNDRQERRAERNDRLRQAQAEARRAAESTFYPPLKATRVSLNSSTSVTPKLQVLQSAYINILLMWGSISVAVLAYGCLCIYISMFAVKSVLQGPHQLVEYYETYNAIAAWLACAFGGLNFIWITSRTFEPILDGLQMKHGNNNPLHTIATFFSSSKAEAERVRRELRKDGQEVDLGSLERQSEDSREERKDGHKQGKVNHALSAIEELDSTMDPLESSRSADDINRLNPGRPMPPFHTRRGIQQETRFADDPVTFTAPSPAMLSPRREQHQQVLPRRDEREIPTYPSSASSHSSTYRAAAAQPSYEVSHPLADHQSPDMDRQLVMMMDNRPLLERSSSTPLLDHRPQHQQGQRQQKSSSLMMLTTSNSSTVVRSESSVFGNKKAIGNRTRSRRYEETSTYRRDDDLV